MRKLTLRMFLLIFPAVLAVPSPRPELASGTVTFRAADGVTVTGDLYAPNGNGAPFIILCHMAGSSRGEYVSIAPRLNELGFNCLAVDQRSGAFSNGVENLTAKSAREKGKGRSYADAYPDIEAALLFVKRSFRPETVILWGSSYSADIVLTLAAKRPGDISAVLAFSPGGYFRFEGIPLDEYAAGIEIPVFIAASKSEASRSRPYFDAVRGACKTFFLPATGNGDHGSPALYESCRSAPEYWAAVETFLRPFTGQ